MARTWEDAAAVLRDLAEAVPELRRRIIALAITGQGDGTWLVGREGEPVAPAWLWLELAVRPIVRELDGAGVRRADVSAHGLRPQRVQPIGASGLAQATRARAARPRVHSLSLQGLAVFQARPGSA